MQQKLSRREFGKKAAVVAAALSATKNLMAQNKTQPVEAVTEADLDHASGQTRAPLSEDAKKLLKSKLSGIRRETQRRLQSGLPENSEPSFIFVAKPKAQPEELQ